MAHVIHLLSTRDCGNGATQASNPFLANSDEDAVQHIEPAGSEPEKEKDYKQKAGAIAKMARRLVSK